MKSPFVALVGLVLLASCADDSVNAPSIPDATNPAFHISEARSGGNSEFFFGTPLAPDPKPGDTNFDVGGANSVLAPRVRICETNGAPNASGCVTDVTQQVTGSATGLLMEFTSADELYRIAWRSNLLTIGVDYRIEIWGIAFSTPAEKAALDPRWLFGWRDIRHATNPPDCRATDAFCLVTFGEILPVKARIEQFVFCPLTRDCAVQFIRDGEDANLEVTLPAGAAAPNAQVFVPAQTGTNFTLAFLPCSAAEDAIVSAAVDIPTYGPCLRTITSFTGVLSIPAIVSLCDQLDATPFGLSDAQEEQLSLHHFTNDLSRVQSLPEAHQCLPATSGVAAAQRSVRQWLASVGSRVFSWVKPTPLYATTMIDRGGGGESPFLDSFFKLGLPAKFEYETPGDAQQSGVAGSTLLLRAKVTDLFGAAVRNARVHWRAVTPPGDGATVLGSVPPGATLTDAEGVAHKTVQLASASGFNVFHAFGRGIADDRETGCTVAPSTPSSCNGPRTAYDPFLPFHVPEFDPAGTEDVVELPNGTRLLFTVFGCAAGVGSATIDGLFTTGEWGCAKAFPFTAKVSGGSVPATLYVMNDGSNLYLALRIQRPLSDKVNTLQFNFDNNNSWSLNGSGAAEAGDDVLSLDAVKGFVDAVLPPSCTRSGQSACWQADANELGTNDGAGSVKNDGVFTTYELSHPLNTTDDPRDFSLGAGSKVGLFLTLQIGNGAQGNTQWPGFRRYLEVRIEP